MGTENNITYLTLSREREHMLILVMAAEIKLSYSHQECQVCIAPLDIVWFPERQWQNNSRGTGLRVGHYKDSSAAKLMMWGLADG